MKAKRTISLALLTLALCGAVLYGRWALDAPRRAALASLARLEAALHSGNRQDLLNVLAAPAAVRGRSVPEQTEFLVKALTDEISPEGLAVLQKHGAYGPLKELFPTEAEAWAKQAEVKPDDCVAFKLERPGLRAEVVLVKPATPDWPYQILRLNNVRQLAELNVPTTEKTP